NISIVHISDLHVRRGDQRLLRAQRSALKGLAPDLLCVTGDVCEKVEDIPLLVHLLQAAKPRLGTFVVLGNHEHNAHAPAHLRHEQARGWRRLLNVLIEPFAPDVRRDGDEEGQAMASAATAAGTTALY